MKKQFSKEEVKKQIEKLAESSSGFSQESIKKLKRNAMKHSIKLGKARRRFCQKCYAVFNSGNSRTRILKGIKRIECLKCGKIARYQMN